MTVAFELPDVGEGVAEGEIVRWLVEAGDRVSEDQPVVEVETDKAVVEIPAPVDGTVERRLFEAGEVVPVGEVFVTFAVEDGGASGGAATDETAERDVAASDDDSETSRAATPSGDDPGSESADRPTSSAADGAEREHTLARPTTRRLAAELDVDLEAVPADETHEGEPFVTAAAVRAFAVDEPGEDAHESTAGTPSDRAREERVPYRGIRRTIGQRMERSKFTIPHATYQDEADVTELVAVRRELNEALPQGEHLTVLPFLVRAVVAALEAHPYVNSELDEEAGEIVLKRQYDIGVATDTDRGLLVPVVEDADRGSLRELAAAIDEVVTAARDGSIGPDRLRGSTFTITNFGAIGGEYGTPIINYPEVAILGCGAIRERPRIVDGDVVARTVMGLSLSVDHRVIDGATAARFTDEVKAHLERPRLALL